MLHLCRDLNRLVSDERIEIVLITQTKLSMMQAVSDYSELFDVIITTGLCFDPEFYCQITKMLLPSGIYWSIYRQDVHVLCKDEADLKTAANLEN